MSHPSGVLLIPLILSLSLDTFAVSAAIGIAPMTAALRWRFALACAAAEAGMPLLGFLLGGLLGRLGSVADWLSVALLFGAGLWLVREAREDEDELAEAIGRAQQGGVALLAVALSISLDELAVGLALGSLRLPVVPVVTTIGGQALLASLLGLRLGAAFGERLGRRAPLLAGLILCVLALWVGVSHLTGR